MPPTQYKILGITLSEDMKMDSHIWSAKNSMSRSLNSKIALLKTLKPYLTTKSLGQIGSGLINSTISYGAPVWGVTPQQNIDRLQKLQTRAARVIVSKGWEKGGQKPHRQDILDSLNWPNVNQIVTSTTMNLAKSAINGKSSQGINQMFTIAKPNNPRQGQGARISHKGKIKTKSNTFATIAPTMFNKLPAVLRDPEMSTTNFKRNLKQHVLTQQLLTKH